MFKVGGSVRVSSLQHPDSRLPIHDAPDPISILDSRFSKRLPGKSSKSFSSLQVPVELVSILVCRFSFLPHDSRLTIHDVPDPISILVSRFSIPEKTAHRISPATTLAFN